MNDENKAKRIKMVDFSQLLNNPSFLAGASILGSRGNIGQGLLGYSQLQQGMMQNKLIESRLAELQAQKDRMAAQKIAFGQPGKTEMMGPPYQGQYQRQQSPGTGIYSGNPEDQQNALRNAALLTDNPFNSLVSLMPKKTRPSSLEEKLMLYKSDPKLYRSIFPGQNMTIHMPNVTQAAKAATGLRIDQAAEQIKALENAGGSGLDFWDAIVTNYAPDEVSSFMRSDDGNRIVAAQNAWIETFGRDASGAAIPKTEWASWRKTYFAQPGEGEDIAAMKKQNRIASEAAIKSQALGGKLPAPQSSAGIISSGKKRTAKEKIQSEINNVTGDMDSEGWITTPEGYQYRIRN